MKIIATLLLVILLFFSKNTDAQNFAWRQIDFFITLEYFRFQKIEIILKLNDAVLSHKLKAYPTPAGKQTLKPSAIHNSIQSSAVFTPFWGLPKNMKKNNDQLCDNIIHFYIRDSMFSNRSRLGFLIDQYKATDISFIDRQTIYYVDVQEAFHFLSATDSFFLCEIFKQYNKESKANLDLFLNDRALKSIADTTFIEMKYKMFYTAFSKLQAYDLPNHDIRADSLVPVSKAYILNSIARISEMPDSKYVMRYLEDSKIKQRVKGIGILEKWDKKEARTIGTTVAYSTAFNFGPDMNLPLFYIKTQEISSVLSPVDLTWLSNINYYYFIRRIDEWQGGGYGKPYTLPHEFHKN